MVFVKICENHGTRSTSLFERNVSPLDRMKRAGVYMKTPNNLNSRAGRNTEGIQAYSHHGKTFAYNTQKSVIRE